MVISTSQTTTMSAFGKGVMAFYKKHGFDVYFLAYDNGRLETIADEGFEFFNISYVRALDLISDIKAFFQVMRIFRKLRPDVIQLATTKPCFLCGIAGKLTGVPLIIRHKWGSLLECNYRGLKRFLLFNADRVANRLADRIVSVSHELLESEVDAGTIDAKKGIVYGNGSAFGLNIDFFKLTGEKKKKAIELRQQWGVGENEFVFGTAMRINIEKGICELVEAFVRLYEKKPYLRLKIAGQYDIRNSPPEEIIRTIEEHPGITFVGFQEDISVFYAAIDAYVMPSYREGFCNSNLEASGMEKAIVSTDIIGVNGSSVIDGVTGLIVPPRNAEALADAMDRIASDRELARNLGRQGRERIVRGFSNKLVWHNQLKDICLLLKKKRIDPPVEPDQIIKEACPLCSSSY